jgi:hypothetical protein
MTLHGGPGMWEKIYGFSLVVEAEHWGTNSKMEKKRWNGFLTLYLSLINANIKKKKKIKPKKKKKKRKEKKEKRVKEEKR